MSLISTENTIPGVEKKNVKWISSRVLVYVLIFFFSAVPCKKYATLICRVCILIIYLAFVATIIVLNERMSLQLDEKLDYTIVYWQVCTSILVFLYLCNSVPVFIHVISLL